MRSIGKIKDENRAARFIDYLLTQKIVARADDLPIVLALGSESSTPVREFEIWVQDEDQIQTARQALIEFEQDPGAAKYEKAAQEAAQIRRAVRDRAAEVASLQRKLPQQSMPMAPGGQRFGKITLTLSITAVIVTLLTNFSQPSLTVVEKEGYQEITDANELSSKFKFVDLMKFEMTDPPDPLISIKEGEVWRFFTPALMHGNLPHLVFNVLSLISLGSVCEHLFGRGIYLWLLLASHAAGTLCQALMPFELGGNPNFVGLSGVVYGVFGFLWARPWVQTSLPPILPGNSVALMLGWMLLGWLPIPGLMMANWAHLGGLLGGMACALTLPRVRRKA